MIALSPTDAAEAIFASTVQRADTPTPHQLEQAIEQAVGRLSVHGCAAVVAFEFGAHPETAAPRMKWALALAATLGQPPTS
jgi:hypothetical protein